MTSKHRFRVFLSYSHDDRELAREVAAILQDSCGLVPVWDRDIRPGERFTDTIKSMIASAHLFFPLLTEKSLQRPWVHQETGYAIALNIPVLPLAHRSVQSDTILGELHAVIFQEPSELVQLLANDDFERLVNPMVSLPQQLYHEAYWPEERTQLLAKNANLVAKIRGFGMVRQAGALTSFCLPDADLDDPIWTARDGNPVRSDYYHQLQREERRALEQHAVGAGCRLVIYPHQDYRDRGTGVRCARLTTLVEFLKSASPELVEVALTETPNEGSLTIVGDSFLAESLLPGRGGYRQTVFKWHAPTVYQRIQQFDGRFAEMRKRKPLTLSQVIEILERERDASCAASSAVPTNS